MNSLVQWPRHKYWDKVWNPMIGCKPCSPACEHCYAAAWAKRFGQSLKPHDTKQRPPRSGVVFCGSGCTPRILRTTSDGASIVAAMPIFG